MIYKTIKIMLVTVLMKQIKRDTLSGDKINNFVRCCCFIINNDLKNK